MRMGWVRAQGRRAGDGGLSSPPVASSSLPQPWGMRKVCWREGGGRGLNTVRGPAPRAESGSPCRPPPLPAGRQRLGAAGSSPCEHGSGAWRSAGSAEEAAQPTSCRSGRCGSDDRATPASAQHWAGSARVADASARSTRGQRRGSQSTSGGGGAVGSPSASGRGGSTLLGGRPRDTCLGRWGTRSREV